MKSEIQMFIESGPGADEYGLRIEIQGGAFSVRGIPHDELDAHLRSLVDQFSTHTSVSSPISQNQEERDKKSIKCPECDGHIMLSNSMTYSGLLDESAEAQYRPIFGKIEKVTMEGSCIKDPLHHVKLFGTLVINGFVGEKK